MSKRQKQNSYKNQGTNSSRKAYFKPFIIAALLFTLFYPPFLRGLFFETEQLFTEVLILGIFIIYSIHKTYKKGNIQLKTPLEYISFGFLLIYFISIFYAVSVNAAALVWLRYCMFFAVVIMVTDLFADLAYKYVLVSVNIAASFFICIIGLDSFATGNIIKVLNIFFKTIGLTERLGLEDFFFRLSGDGRVYSTFQYPNALAAYLMSIFILSIGMYIISTKQVYKIMYSAISFIVLTTFVLTLSRGAFIIIPFAVILFLIALPQGYKAKGLINIIAVTITASVTAAVLYQKYIVNAVLSNKLWFWIVAGVCVTYIALLIGNYIVSKIQKVNYRILIPIMGVMVISAIAGGYYVVNSNEPITLEHSETETDSSIYLNKGSKLKSEKTYKFNFSVEASMAEEKDFAYKIRIASKTRNDILFDKENLIAEFTGKATVGTEEKTIEFEVPAESELVNFTLINVYQGTKATFYKAQVYEAESGKLIQDFRIGNKYIPQTIISRFENMTTSKSNLERQIFYKDGLKILKEYVFGAGGGAWPFIYFSHQSYLYFTSEPHSFPLKVAIETGVLGLLLIGTLFVVLIYLYIKFIMKEQKVRSKENVLHSALYSAVFALLMHSMIDFDLSLTAIYLLLWQLIGLLNSGLSDNTVKPRIKNIKINPVIGLVISIIVIAIPIMVISSKAYAKEMVAASQTNQSDAALSNAKKAVKINPFNAGYRVDYASLILKKQKLSQSDMQEANKRVSEADKLGKYDADTQGKIGAYYLATGEIDKGLEHFDALTELKPYEVGAWQVRADAYIRVAKYYLENGDYTQVNKYMKKAATVIKASKDINSNNLNPFKFEDLSIIKSLEDMYYINQYTDILTNGDSTKININDLFSKLVFTSMADFDINNDSEPDQFIVTTADKTKLYYSGNAIVWDNGAEDKGSISTRKLTLAPGKRYRVEIKSDQKDTESISYSISGVSTEAGKFLKDKDLLYADFETSSGYNAESSVIILSGTGKIKIEYIRIYEN